MRTRSRSLRMPDPLERPRLERSIGFNIARHLAQSKRPQDRKAAELGLGRDEWRLLLALHEYGAQPSARLAALTFLDPAVISRAVSRMKRAGHVTRLSDVRDRRVAIIRLTPAGRDVAARVADWHFARDGLVRSVLTDSELALWLLLNDKLHARMKDLAAADDPDG